MSLKTVVIRILLCIVVVGVIPTKATLGIDLSTSTSKTAFSCLKDQGYEFVIVRAYLSYGEPDRQASLTIANAKAAGFEYIDVYMFPCPKCSKSASTQVSEMVNSINGSYGQIWLDIEGTQYWHSDTGENQRFFEELLSAASKYKRTGVYSSEFQWNPIMGSGYSGGSGHQLWYAHYDGNPSFSDFQAFGGWSRPAIKQFEGDKSACGAGIDKNYY